MARKEYCLHGCICYWLETRCLNRRERDRVFCVCLSIILLSNLIIFHSLTMSWCDVFISTYSCGWHQLFWWRSCLLLRRCCIRILTLTHMLSGSVTWLRSFLFENSYWQKPLVCQLMSVKNVNNRDVFFSVHVRFSIPDHGSININAVMYLWWHTYV